MKLKFETPNATTCKRWTLTYPSRPSHQFKSFSKWATRCRWIQAKFVTGDSHHGKEYSKAYFSHGAICTHQTWKYSLDEYDRYKSPPKPRSNFIKKMHSNSVSLAEEFPFRSMSYNFLISALLRCARHRGKECNQNAGHWVNFPSIICDSLDLN